MAGHDPTKPVPLEWRWRRNEVQDVDGFYAEGLESPANQHSRLEFEEFRLALAKLPDDQRETLILVVAAGYSYDEAAAICECAVGTIKSRLNRARTRLAELLLENERGWDESADLKNQAAARR